jgi:hypothetical protein
LGGMKNILIVALLVTLLPCMLLAGETLVQQGSTGGQQSLLSLGSKSPFSLFDPSRFHMSQSYSISFFSGGGQSNSIAMYLNRMDYDLTDNLRLSVGFAWLHQPQAALGFSKQTISNELLPSASLDWRPSSNFHLQVNFETLSPYLYNYDRLRGYQYPEGYSRYERVQ